MTYAILISGLALVAMLYMCVQLGARRQRQFDADRLQRCVAAVETLPPCRRCGRPATTHATYANGFALLGPDITARCPVYAMTTKTESFK